MAYTNFQNCTANEYKNIIYNQETNNKIKILFNNIELEDADEYCESFEVISRVIPNGSKTFMLENLVSQEATLVLHNIDTSIIQDQVSISIGTLVSSNSLGDTYEYVPIGIYNLQEIPTTDNGKTTIKLRDNSVKLDFNYNAKPLIDLNGGSATKLQILQDICTKAGITCNVSSFIGSSDLIGIYDNTITGRQYVSYLAGSAGAIPIITRSGALDFKYLNNLSTIEIPIEIVEQYSNAENFKISRVVYEDAIRKYESGNETYDTLFLDSANPYISSQEQVASIYNIVNNFEINSFKTGRILGNPAIDSYDLIQITDYDNTVFKTFANNTLRYNGKMINTFASEISFERKKENVSLKSGATFKKWAKTEIDNANAQITIQAGQIDEIEESIQNPTSTKQSEYFDLEDALDEPLIDFSLYGQTQQDSTTGKNLAQPNENIVTSKGGITCSYNSTDQTFTFNGTCDTDNSTFQLTTTFISFTGGSTTSSIHKVSGTIEGYCKMRHYDSNYQKNCSYDVNDSAISSATSIDTFTSAANSTIRFNSGSKATNFKIKLMVAQSTNTDYEPYTNGASPNPDYPQPIHNVSGDNTIEICGKNLLPINIENGSTKNGLTITKNDDGSYTLNGTTTANTTWNLYSGENITIPAGTYTGSFVGRNNIVDGYIRLNDGAYETIFDNTHDTNTFTISEPFTFNRFYIYIPRERTFNNQVIKPQLEKNNEATTFETYTGNSQLISLGDIELNKISTYQDYIYKDSDKWYLHKEIGKVVLDGSEEWGLANNVFYKANNKGLQQAGIKIVKSNYFQEAYNQPSTNNVNRYNPQNSICGSSSSANRIYIKTNIASTTEDFKTWLSTHNTIVYYVLATPTNTEITDTTLLEQLNNLMTLPLYKNMTHITLTPNDLQPTMKIEYYRDTSINENFVPKEDMTKYYTKTETNAQIKITGDSISSEVARVEDSVNDNNTYISRVETSVTNLQTDTNILLDFRQNVQQNGVEALRNTLIQADINGINITKGDKYKNLMTDRNQQIFSNNKEIMFMGYDDNLQKTVARIRELEARLITVGYHRTEMIQEDGENWTADYYVGGDN